MVSKAGFDFESFPQFQQGRVFCKIWYDLQIVTPSFRMIKSAMECAERGLIHEAGLRFAVIKLHQGIAHLHFGTNFDKKLLNQAGFRRADAHVFARRFENAGGGDRVRER